MEEHLAKKKSSFDYRPCCSDRDYFIVLGELYCEARVLKPGHRRKGVTLKGAAFLESVYCMEGVVPSALCLCSH